MDLALAKLDRLNGLRVLPGHDAVGKPGQGGVPVGGDHPIATQSMLTCDTMNTSRGASGAAASASSAVDVAAPGWHGVPVWPLAALLLLTATLRPGRALEESVPAAGLTLLGVIIGVMTVVSVVSIIASVKTVSFARAA